MQEIEQCKDIERFLHDADRITIQRFLYYLTSMLHDAVKECDFTSCLTHTSNMTIDLDGTVRKKNRILSYVQEDVLTSSPFQIGTIEYLCTWVLMVVQTIPKVEHHPLFLFSKKVVSGTIAYDQCKDSLYAILKDTVLGEDIIIVSDTAESYGFEEYTDALFKECPTQQDMYSYPHGHMITVEGWLLDLRQLAIKECSYGLQIICTPNTTFKIGNRTFKIVTNEHSPPPKMTMYFSTCNDCKREIYVSEAYVIVYNIEHKIHVFKPTYSAIESQMAHIGSIINGSLTFEFCFLFLVNEQTMLNYVRNRLLTGCRSLDTEGQSMQIEDGRFINMDMNPTATKLATLFIKSDYIIQEDLVDALIGFIMWCFQNRVAFTHAMQLRVSLQCWKCSYAGSVYAPGMLTIE